MSRKNKKINVFHYSKDDSRETIRENVDNKLKTKLLIKKKKTFYRSKDKMKKQLNNSVLLKKYKKNKRRYKETYKYQRS